MPDRIDLSEARARFEETMEYPAGREEVSDEFSDTIIVFSGGGEENLGSLISQIGTDAFESAEDLYSELQNVLPVEAVGEPGQSEGEG